MSKLLNIVCENNDCKLNKDFGCMTYYKSKKNLKLTKKQLESKTTKVVKLEPIMDHSALRQCWFYMPIDNKN